MSSVFLVLFIFSLAFVVCSARDARILGLEIESSGDNSRKGRGMRSCILPWYGNLLKKIRSHRYSQAQPEETESSSRLETILKALRFNPNSADLFVREIMLTTLAEWELASHASIAVVVLQDEMTPVFLSPNPVSEKLRSLITNHLQSIPKDTLEVRDLITAAFAGAEIKAHNVRHITSQAGRYVGIWIGFPEQHVPDALILDSVRTLAAHLEETYSSLRPTVSALRNLENSAKELHDVKLSIAQLTHDLRSALSCLTHGLDFIDEKKTRQLDPETQKLLELAKINSACAVSVLDGFDDIGKKSESTCEPESDLFQITSEILNVFLLKSENQRTVLVVDIPEQFPKVRCDPGDLRRVLLNLVGNAVKFTHDGVVRIEARIAAGKAKLSVLDTGSGIDPKILPEAFAPYVTGGTRNSGSGLGLSVVKSLVERNEGQISIHTGELGGTRVEIVLPVIKRDIQEHSPEKFLQTRKAILLVDDDIDSSRSLARLLEKEGFTIKITHTLTEALFSARDFEYVLTDLDMPDGGGKRLIKELCRDEKGPKVGVLTGADDELLAYEALGLGAEVLFRKPVGVGEIREWVG